MQGQSNNIPHVIENSETQLVKLMLKEITMGIEACSCWIAVRLNTANLICVRVETVWVT